MLPNEVQSSELMLPNEAQSSELMLPRKLLCLLKIWIPIHSKKIISKLGQYKSHVI